jgi:hypothetical protein
VQDEAIGESVDIIQTTRACAKKLADGSNSAASGEDGETN